MIISKSPIRISMGAGGIDLPAFYTKYGASFVTAAGSKYTYVMVNSHPEAIVWMGMNQAERVDSPEQLRHPVVKEVLSWMGFSKNLEVVSMSDVHQSSGVGTSSSFIVGLLHALHAHRGEYPWPDEVAQEACYVEQVLMKENAGKQDQYASALGGIISIKIEQDGKVTPTRLGLKKDFVGDLDNRIAYFYTGIQRQSTRIQEWHDQVELGDPKRLETLQRIQAIALEISRALRSQDIESLGTLLRQHWEYKKSLSDQISNPELDRIYATALKNGAIGGNLMGAGGGGHFMFVSNAKAGSKPELIRALSSMGLRPVDMHFEMEGSTVTTLS